MDMVRYILFLSAVLFSFSCTEPETEAPGIWDEPIEDYWPDDDDDGQDDDGAQDDDSGQDSDEGGDVFPPGFKDETNDKSKDQVLSFDYSVLAKAGHPRLMMTEGDFEELKYRLGKDKVNNKVLLQVHRVIISKAEEYAAMTTAMSNPSAHEENVAELLALAYAYRVTGGSKYLTRIKTDIKNILKWTKLGSGELGIGEHSLAIAIVYDWLYYDLTYDERVGLRKLVTTKAIVPSLTFAFRGYHGNWNQVGNGGIMCAALAMYEKNKAAAVNNIEKGLVDNKAMLQKVLVGGGYPEGLSYWGYGMTYQVALFQSLLNIFGHTGGLMEVPGVMDSGMYALMVHGTNYTSFSYNDGGTTGDCSLIPSWWYAAQKQDPDLVYGEYYLMRTDRYANHYSRFTPLIPSFLKSFNPDMVLSRQPDAEIWSCKGQMPLCMVRRGWNYDKSDLYLGIKGGDCNTWASMSTAHGHMDAGSFVFEAEGVRWSDDVTRPAYGDWFAALEKAGSYSGDTAQKGLRWGTFNINALCHSTIVSYTNDGSISKTHSTDHNVNGSATLTNMINGSNGQGAELNMSAPLKGQVKSAIRTILLLPDGTLEVTDKITALDSKDSVVEWRMLTQSTGSVTSTGIELTSIKDTAKKRKLSVTCSGATVAYKMVNPTLPSDWTGFTYIQKINDRKIASWKATVPKGKTVTFKTTLKKL